MDKLELMLTEEGESNLSETLECLIQAAQEVAKASEKDFEKMKSKKWYKRLWELITLSKDNQKLQARGVANLAKLQEIIFKAILILSRQNKETAEILSEAVEEISELKNDVILNTRVLQRLVSEIRKLKYNYDKSYTLEELQLEEQEIVLALLYDYIRNSGIQGNAYTEDFAASIMQNWVPATGITVESHLEKLKSEAQELLYRYEQSYYYLATDEFDDGELFDEFDLSRKKMNNIKVQVKEMGAIYGKANYANSLKGFDEAELYVEDWNDIEYDIEDEEEPVQEKKVWNYACDHEELEEIIHRYSEIDENTGKSANFGISIYKKEDVLKQLNEMGLYDLSYEAGIAAFRAEQNLLFTTHAIYYMNAKNKIPYSKLSEKNIFTEVVRETDLRLIVKVDEDEIIIDDKKINVSKMKELLVDLIGVKSSNRDRNIRFSDLNETAHVWTLALILFVLQKGENSAEELYRYYLDSGFKFSWNHIEETCETIWEMDDINDAYFNVFNQIPYPSAESIMQEIYAIILRILIYTKGNTRISEAEQEIIRGFTFDEYEDVERNILINAVVAEMRYVKKEISFKEYLKSAEKAMSQLKMEGHVNAGLQLMPKWMMIPTNKKESCVKEFQTEWIETLVDSYIKAYKVGSQELLGLCNPLMGKMKLYVALRYNLQTVSDKFMEALLKESPELFFGYQKAIPQTCVDERVKIAEKHYLKYQIQDVMPQLEMLAEMGFARACYMLGSIYAEGYGGIKQNVVKAKLWLIRGIELGDVLAVAKYAKWFLTEEEDRRSCCLIFSKLLKMAQNKDCLAQHELARLYYNGFGVDVNDENGAAWRKAAAYNGHFDSQNRAAYHLWNGSGGFEKDRESAKKFWNMSVKSEFEPAIYNAFKFAGICSEEFQQLTEAGHAECLNYRGYYRVTLGDKENAVWDIKRAADLGSDNAKKNYLKYLEKKKFGLFFPWKFEDVLF